MTLPLHGSDAGNGFLPHQNMIDTERFVRWKELGDWGNIRFASHTPPKKKEQNVMNKTERDHMTTPPRKKYYTSITACATEFCSLHVAIIFMCRENPYSHKYTALVHSNKILQNTGILQSVEFTNHLFQYIANQQKKQGKPTSSPHPICL